MDNFCGAFDISGGGVDFSLLCRMNGNHSGGCAYLSGDIGIVCELADISLSSIQPVIKEMDGDTYTAAIITDTQNDIELLCGVIDGYAREGMSGLCAVDPPHALVLYDTRWAELYLCRSQSSPTPIFLIERDTCVYFFTRFLSIYKLCESVGINQHFLWRYLRSQIPDDAYAMFCGLEAIECGEGVMYTRFGRSDLAFGVDIEYTKEDHTRICAKGDIKKELTAALFEHGYPYPVLPELSHKELKKLDKELDTYLDELLLNYGRKSFYAFVKKERVALKKEKSIPRRVIAKGMLYQTLIWAEHFNIYFT